MTNPTMITTRAILFYGSTRESGLNELAEHLRERGIEQLALRRAPAVSALLRLSALRELVEAIDGLLQVDLGGVMVEGWRRYERLRSAAVRTHSGGSEQVELLGHEVTQTYCPRLDVTIDGTRVGELNLELCVTLLLQPLTATVRDGLLVALGPGDCTVTASIAVPELAPIMERKRTLHVATLVDLRRPIPLVYRRPAAPPSPIGRTQRYSPAAEGLSEQRRI
ncbi:hypothetical protein ACLMAJ_34685 [Nocardia sp. KC 131]|uniref:hypothetical protein n=1 Tax=Nocardia arseniciresistens TaxID=3392119 RepID=UPI00398E7F1A